MPVSVEVETEMPSEVAILGTENGELRFRLEPGCQFGRAGPRGLFSLPAATSGPNDAPKPDRELAVACSTGLFVPSPRKRDGMRRLRPTGLVDAVIARRRRMPTPIAIGATGEAAIVRRIR